MKCVVTGGAGFIGSHIVDALIARGDEVHIVDNFVTGKRENVNSRAVVHKEDIRNSDALLRVFSGAELVFHCAALARVQPSIENPLEYHSVNSGGTMNVLTAARDAGVKRVVYSASSSAYGNQDVMPLYEEMEARPMSPYALQKYSGELKMRLFSELYGLETVSLRYFNVYGPRQVAEGAYATVVGIFLEQRKKGMPLTVVPDGKQKRDFTHVADVARANLCAAESPKVGKGETINIGTGKNYTVLDVAELVGGPKVFVEPRIEPKCTLADISRAKELLGWEPNTNFEEGIAELKRIRHIV